MGWQQCQAGCILVGNSDEASASKQTVGRMHCLAVAERRSLVFCELWMGNSSQHVEAALRPLPSVPAHLSH